VRDVYVVSEGCSESTYPAGVIEAPTPRSSKSKVKPSGGYRMRRRRGDVLELCLRLGDMRVQPHVALTGSEPRRRMTSVPSEYGACGLMPSVRPVGAPARTASSCSIAEGHRASSTPTIST
jgi:hypothetical protein